MKDIYIAPHLIGNSHSHFEQIALGNVPNIKHIYKFGRNPSVGTSEEIIWDGGNGYIFPANAVACEAVSSSALDNEASTGAHQVEVSGLDDNFCEISEIITLNGTTPVALTNLYRRIYRASVIDGGIANNISGSNVGNITIRQTVTQTPLAIILTGNAQTCMSVYTVPDCYTALVWAVTASVGEGKSVLIRVKTRNAENLYSSFSTKAIRDLYQSSIIQRYTIPLVLPPRTDIIMTAINLKAGDVDVSSTFEMELIKTSTHG